eukprot:TRINITY_DN3601_c0_g1_i1.p1 TRINITY_DN3601_c0_g1~~TRINITY_DN3601_c0_g1_i1.p1  ORF type:complete len:135 (+),score=46.40 TRINITY_DN3601_c0_g1_i1:73-477(+)
MTIEQQVMALENATVTRDTMKAMKHGAASMKQIHKNMTVDDVDDVMDEIREQMDVANEISTAIGQPLGDVIDETELEGELAELEQENIDEQLLKVDASPIKLPAVPAAAATAAPAAASKAEEDELAQLEKAMAV